MQPAQASGRPSIIISILAGLCPGCRKVSMFKGRIWDLKELGNVHHHCPNCGTNLRIEIGFYWGGLYIAYGLAVFTSFAQFLFYYYVLDLSMTISVVLFIIGQLLLALYLVRLSKAMWAHLFIPYSKI